MKDFIHLKRTYPISQIERNCDAYNYLVENTSEEQRLGWGISIGNLKRTILPKEKYIYQVGLEEGTFKIMCSSFENFAIVREFIFGVKDK